MSSKNKQRQPSKHSNKKKSKSKITVEATGKETFKILDYGACALQGKRDYMEDTHVAVLAEKESDLGARDILGYFSVFDGHGGNQTSQFLQEHFFDYLWQEVKIVDQQVPALKQPLTQAFLNLEQDMHKVWIETNGKNLENSGSTAVSVIVRSKEIICANVGDSRAVFSRAGGVVPLSIDQRPSRKCEKKRLEDNNILINQNYVESNGYLLSISRTFADFELKEAPDKSLLAHPLTPNPELQRVEPLRGDDFLILASDGLWDVISNEEAVAFVRSAHKRFNGSAQKIAHALANSALGRGSKDNITVIIVCLDVQENEEEEDREVSESL